MTHRGIPRFRKSFAALTFPEVPNILGRLCELVAHRF